MAFQVSPGVRVSEIDLTTVVPGVSTNIGGFAGVFRWGPVDELSLIASEGDLVNRYGKPSNFNAETFFTAANFISYGGSLFINRAANTVDESGVVGVLTAYANTGAVSESNTSFIVKNEDHYNTISSFDSEVKYVAKYPGKIGDSLKVSVCDSEATYSSTINLKNVDGNVDGNAAETKITFTVGSNTASIVVANAVSKGITNTLTLGNIVKGKLTVGDILVSGNSSIGKQYLKITSVANATDIKEDSARAPDSFSASANVAANGAITLGSTPVVAYEVGDQVTYLVATGNTAVVGLSNNATYFVAAKTSASIYLSSTQGGPIITLTPGISETGHTITQETKSTGDALVAVSLASKYTLAQDYEASEFVRNWEYFNVIDNAPTQTYSATEAGSLINDAIHLVVVDEDGDFSGIKNTILEVFADLSRATDAKTEDGATNYYKSVINDRSSYVWWTNDRTGAVSAPLISLTNSTNTAPLNISFVGGSDGADEANVPVSVVSLAFDKFISAEDVDISFVLTGKSRGGSYGEQLGNYLVDNIAEARKDCVVFISPSRNTVVNNVGNEASDIIEFRNAVTSSSYGFMDTGYKYQYDKYNDVYRYIPLNGDMGGLAVRSDVQRDPWYSFAGSTRGVVKNIVKLAYNPNKPDRDLLYKSDVNPVVAFPGQGILLYGDKTLLGRPSAFDRINVRRLFIVLEKAIAIAARSSLFEFNDEFTRSQFKGIIDPFLGDVQGRRGIVDFKTVCDSTNNTAEVIDRGEFVGDIYIKPARSINYIQLNFVAIRSGVEFTEIVGRF